MLQAGVGADLMATLLADFAHRFAEPLGLPPARTYDHRIHLLPNAPAIFVRPYKYAHIQKDKIERQCATMLTRGIIRPSSSPFSSPVLLVRKKDASWCFAWITEL